MRQVSGERGHEETQELLAGVLVEQQLVLRLLRRGAVGASGRTNGETIGAGKAGGAAFGAAGGKEGGFAIPEFQGATLEVLSAFRDLS